MPETNKFIEHSTLVEQAEFLKDLRFVISPEYIAMLLSQIAMRDKIIDTAKNIAETNAKNLADYQSSQETNRKKSPYASMLGEPCSGMLYTSNVHFTVDGVTLLNTKKEEDKARKIRIISNTDDMKTYCVDDDTHVIICVVSGVSFSEVRNGTETKLGHLTGMESYEVGQD